MVGGLNDRARLCLHVFSAAIDVAVRRGCCALFVLGDVFDQPRPPPALTAAVQRELLRARGAGVEPVLLVGNHDRASSAPGDHALAPLAPVATVVETTRVVEVGGVRVLCWPFEGMVEGRDPEQADVIAMHCGIEDASTPPWLKGKGLAVERLGGWMGDTGVRACFAGDWHRRATYAGSWGDAVQVGTLCPAGFDDEGLEGYGRVFFTDGALLDGEEEIPGPRFVKTANREATAKLAADLLAGQDAVEEGGYLYLKEACAPADYAARHAELTALELSGAIQGFQLEPDEAEAVAATRSAAEAARSSKTLDEALSVYVAQMPLEHGEDRDLVLARCRRFLDR